MKDKEKFANNTDVYSQGFPQYFAEFVFLNLMGSTPHGLSQAKKPITQSTAVISENTVTILTSLHPHISK